MRIHLEAGRDGAPTIDPAAIAAIAAVLLTETDAPASAPVRATSPWRAAGRSVEAFDGYDAARYARQTKPSDAPRDDR